MAQPMHCDFTDCPNLGDVLTTQINDGTTMAWCFGHYVEVCREVVRASDDAAATVATEAQGADAGDDPPAFPGTAAVVPRGRSRSRKAHDARARDRVRSGASMSDATLEAALAARRDASGDLAGAIPGEYAGDPADADAAEDAVL